METVNITPFQFIHKDLDITYLHVLYDRQPDYAYDMFEIFLTQTDRRLEMLKTAIEQIDWPQIFLQVHQVRTYICAVGLTKSAGIAAELELNCKNKEQEAVSRLFDELSGDIARYRGAVQEEFHRLEAYISQHF
ncbi:Hpt domain-containing protein [Chitinophaga nivalis]|uniref:Hpt domain-containing protein n=1 Tax=Chitinophaga nivalis TaxID=2991709 RepID=A0ABT3IHW8_9BACT|nr:Hpt domain-containing protein [Chitinophaga nivalis]MCW3466758.1 Hpt domain-containing protein [Chitinophaga nivalis]MCW3483551.1 Hpt domain-containing protein [Chitinophaga nivalis]